MAGKCGCAGTTCSCKIQGGQGISVQGAGTALNPYIISGGGYFETANSDTITFSLLGDGTASAPFQLTGEAAISLGDVLDVDTSTTTVGYVLARHSDGSFFMAPPSVAPIGAVAGGNSIDGDGSGGDPLDVRLRPQSGLQIDAGGLGLLPLTVTSSADLDSTYGSAPVGSFVSDTDGSGAWIKTSGGWEVIIEDTGSLTTIPSIITMAASWNCHAARVWRRNGIVQIYLLVSYNLNIGSPIGPSGDITNLSIGTIIMTNMRPVFTAQLGGASDYGPMVNGYVNSLGAVSLSAALGGVTITGGTQMTLAGTYIGAG